MGSWKGHKKVAVKGANIKRDVNHYCHTYYPECREEGKLAKVAKETHKKTTATTAKELFECTLHPAWTQSQ